MIQVLFGLLLCSFSITSAASNQYIIILTYTHHTHSQTHIPDHSHCTHTLTHTYHTHTHHTHTHTHSPHVFTNAGCSKLPMGDDGKPPSTLLRTSCYAHQRDSTAHCVLSQSEIVEVRGGGRRERRQRGRRRRKGGGRRERRGKGGRMGEKKKKGITTVCS